MRKLARYTRLVIGRNWTYYTTVFAVAAMAISALFIPDYLQHRLLNQWEESAQQVDLIISHKGSPLQIVANTLYRMESPTGNISGETVAFWQKHPYVAKSSRVSLGDSWRSYPIIGVDTNYFSWFGMTCTAGRFPETIDEIVISSTLAAQLDVALGDHLHGTHGGDEHGESHDHHHLDVVGIFEAPRYSDQNALFTLNGAYAAMHGQEADNGETTALIMKLRSKSALVMLPGIISNRSNEQGAFPAFIYNSLKAQWAPTLSKWTVRLRTAAVVLFLFLLLHAIAVLKKQRDTLVFLQRAGKDVKTIMSYWLAPLVFCYSAGFVLAFALWMYIHPLSWDTGVYYWLITGVVVFEALLLWAAYRFLKRL